MTALAQPDAPVVFATPVAAALTPWDAINAETEEIVTAPAPVRPQSKHRPTTRWKRAAAAVGVLCALGIAFAVYQFVFATTEGTLVVEVNDREADVRFKNGELHIYGADGKLKYTLKASERNAKLATGQYTVKVTGADGVVLDTPEFTLSKDGQVKIRVTAKPAAAVAAKEADPDRKAAEWVLSIGGTVRVNGEGSDLKAATDLPASFRLTWVDLRDNAKVDDGGLARLSDCRNLTALYLHKTARNGRGVGPPAWV